MIYTIIFSAQLCNRIPVWPFFRLMLLLLMLIAGLMMGSIPLLSRRASARSLQRGLEFARENVTTIHVGVVKEIAADVSLPAAHLVHSLFGVR